MKRVIWKFRRAGARVINWFLAVHIPSMEWLEATDGIIRGEDLRHRNRTGLRSDVAPEVSPTIFDATAFNRHQDELIDIVMKAKCEPKPVDPELTPTIATLTGQTGPTGFCISRAAEGTVPLFRCLVSMGLAPSHGEARRACRAGEVTINGKTVTDEGAPVSRLDEVGRNFSATRQQSGNS